MTTARPLWLIPFALLLSAASLGAADRTSLAKRRLPATESGFLPSAPLFPSTTAFTLTPDGAVWLGTPHGLWRWSSHHWEYFGGLRYLPSDAIRGLAPVPGDPHSVRVLTSAGAAQIALEPVSLERKAQMFEQRVEDRHNRFGMVADSMLTRPGDLTSNRTVSSDNDGLWTAMYGASQCFRYAVTKSDEARQRAERSVEALLYLEKITGIPGFPARSYVKPGELQPKDGIWYDNPREGLRWKADTSSDEIVGHFFLFSIAFDTLPNPELKERIAETARRIMDHIISHGYNLIDRSGKPTTWGKWSPEYFSGKGRSDSPLNAVELLSFLRAARHITGDAKYDVEYEKVAKQMGYAKIATRYRELSDEINYSDEELALLSFYTLFRYEQEPDLLVMYRQALGGWWHNIARERNPLWNLIALHSDPSIGDRGRLIEEGLVTLEEFPLDMVTWTVDNSHRRDLRWDSSKDRFKSKQTTTWLPPDERPVMKWNGNPFVVNGGNGGRSEDDGSIFLLPCWLGKYWRFW